MYALYYWPNHDTWRPTIRTGLSYVQAWVLATRSGYHKAQVVSVKTGIIELEVRYA